MMLKDLLAFSEQKEEPKQKEPEKNKNPFSFPDGSRIQTQTSMSNAANIAEKIRQQKEKEEAKRKAIEKFLPKKQNKKVDIHKFLKRELDHEQRRQYNIEVMRNKYRDEERKVMQDKPKLSKNSLEISKTLKNPPLYVRTYEEVNKRKASVESLKKLYTQQAQENNNDHNNKLTTYDGSDYKKRNKTENFSAERFNTWLTQQNEWSKKVTKKKMMRSSSLAEEQNKALQDDMSSQPQKSKKSVQSMKILGNQKLKNQRKSSYDRLSTKTENTFNKEMIQLETTPSFTPMINKNSKYNKIKPRYYPDLTSHNQNTTETIKQKRMKKKNNRAKSVDRRKKIEDEIDIMEVGNRRKTESVDHWSTTLLKMGKNRSNINYVPSEILYKLNIMHAAAWNENDVNNVPLQGESKNIIKAFI